MTDFVTVSQTPDGLVTATLWLDGLYLLGLSSRATNVQAVFKPVEGGSLCTATGTMGPANKPCPSGMGLFSLQCYSISCTGAFSGISVTSSGGGSFETVVTADYSICQPAQPNCGMRSAESRTVKLQIPVVVASDSPIPTLISSTQATTSTAGVSSMTSAQSSAVSAAGVTTSSTTVTLTRSTSQSTTTSAPTTLSNTQSESSSNSTGNSIAVGVGIAFGIAALAGIAFAIVRARNGRRNKRLARLSAFSLTYPVTTATATASPRVPVKDVVWTATPGGKPVVALTALDREAAENLARAVNAADASSSSSSMQQQQQQQQQQQPGVMTQVYAAGHAQNQQQQVLFPQYVTPQQQQQQQVQGTYVYPPASTASSQYPGYYDANGQYHFFNNQGQQAAPSHT